MSITNLKTKLNGKVQNLQVDNTPVEKTQLTTVNSVVTVNSGMIVNSDYIVLRSNALEIIRENLKHNSLSRGMKSLELFINTTRHAPIIR